MNAVIRQAILYALNYLRDDRDSLLFRLPAEEAYTILDGVDSALAYMALPAGSRWEPLEVDDPYFDDSPVWLDENGCVCWAGANGETRRLVLHGDMRLCLFVPFDALPQGQEQSNENTKWQTSKPGEDFGALPAGNEAREAGSGGQTPKEPTL